jgi:hypothetical protein
MEQIFEELRERDMDFLLVEEFNVNKEFLVKLFERNIPNIILAKNINAKHSIVDNLYGETDIFISFFIEENNYILLIENKIDAIFQPNQSKRYNLKKENILKNNEKCIIYSVLIAPEKYIKNHIESNDFNICITYEEIMEYFNNNKTDRFQYKSMILNLAIEQSRRGYTVKENEAVTNFWKNYWEYLNKNYPEIIMKQPNIKPYDADWPLLFLYWIPKKWEIFHKLSKGYIDLQTTLSIDEIKKININNNDIIIAKTGKSYSFRINVPKIDRLKDFNSQIDDIKICFEKIKYFNDLKYEVMKAGNFA